MHDASGFLSSLPGKGILRFIQFELRLLLSRSLTIWRDGVLAGGGRQMFSVPKEMFVVESPVEMTIPVGRLEAGRLQYILQCLLKAGKEPVRQ